MKLAVMSRWSRTHGACMKSDCGLLPSLNLHVRRAHDSGWCTTGAHRRHELTRPSFSIEDSLHFYLAAFKKLIGQSIIYN